MFSTSSLPLKTAAKSKDAAGFTMIELVMGFILIGILGAVAVPKYFDMQEQAAAKKCKYNQSVLASDMRNRDAIARIESARGYDIVAARAMADKVMEELGGEGCKSGAQCPKLCPMQTDQTGQFFVVVTNDADAGVMSYDVHCSVPGHAGNKTTTMENAYPLIFSFLNNYTTSYRNGNEGKHDVDHEYIIETLGDYFTNKGVDGRIDSDVFYDRENPNSGLDYGKYGSTEDTKYHCMAEVINASLAEQGVDTSQVVWTMNRESNGGKKYTYNISVANISDIKDDMTVSYSTYKIEVVYGDKRNDGTKMDGIASIQTVAPTSVELGTVTKSGTHYKLNP